jgi:hypothetical protein
MRRFVALSILAIAFAIPCLSQTRALTTNDYARAEKFMGYNANPLVLHSGVGPHGCRLIPHRFRYRVATENGNEFVLVDPARGTRGAAFDHVKLAAALSSASGTTYDAFRLPFTTFNFEDNDRNITFNAGARRWTCDVQGTMCRATDQTPDVPNSVLSPDRKYAAFIRDFNLWVRDVGAGQDRQLTTDGVKDFGYATDNAGWVRSDRPVLLWSPDSKKIATFQHDSRGVGDMYLVHTAVGHPTPA